MMISIMSKTDRQIVRHEAGTESRWQSSLEQTIQLRRVILERPPQPSDAMDLLDCDLRSAAVISRLPDSTSRLYESIALGAGAAAAAALIRTREYAGYTGDVLLTEPDHPTRTIPVGKTGFGYPEWMNGFALASCARDFEALSILCTPICLKACEQDPGRIDPFWGLLCATLASVVTAPTTCRQFAQDADKALGTARIVDHELLEQGIRPLLALALAVAETSQVDFTNKLHASLEAHRQYFSQPDRQFEQEGFLAFRILGLAAIAVDRGLALEIDSGYLPESLVVGPFTGKRSLFSYYYPDRCVFSAQEAHWFLDLEGYPRAGRKHKLIEQGEYLVARYEVQGAPGLPHAIADFVVLDSAIFHDAQRMPPAALDAGELLYLAEIFAGGSESFHGLEQQQEYRHLLADAIACTDAALGRVPEERTVIPPESLHSKTGRTLYQQEPGRFRLDRMQAYRQTLEQALQELDRKLAEQKSDSQPSPGQTQTRGGESDGAMNEACQVAEFSSEIIRSQVLPILEQIAVDDNDEYIAQLQPTAADYARVFTAGTATKARQAYEEAWRRGFRVPRPNRAQTEIHCHVSPAGMFTTDNPLSRYFPGGYRSIAAMLNPHCVWVAWKYVQPGEASGLSFDGLVWVEDHWAWFPKPYRYLRAKEQ